MSDTIFTPILTNLLLSKELNNRDKYVYLKIKQKSSNNISRITMQEIKSVCGISDNRTLINILSKLKNANAIDYEDFDKISRDKITITFSNDSEQFVKVDNEMFNTIEKTFPSNVHNAIVLYYYLEMLYNSNYGYACPSRMEMANVLKLNNTTMTSIIQTMHDEMICEFCQGDRIFSVNDFSSVRTRNRYIPNTIKYGKDGVHDKSNKKRRYSRHKQRSYFFKENYQGTTSQEVCN